MADWLYVCVRCKLRMYVGESDHAQYPDACPACGSLNGYAIAMEFAELPEAERVKRLQQANTKG